MVVGFAGTRQGMTLEQQRALRTLLTIYNGGVLHHGDAVGADAQAHEMAIELGYIIVIHPPLLTEERAFKTAACVREPAPYLLRNKAIVRETEVLIAAPEGAETIRSGTWSTVRFARRVKRPIRVVLPDGEVWDDDAEPD